VSPFPILPPSHGGRVRTYRLAAGLACAGAAVDLLCPWSPGLPARRARLGRVAVHPHAFATNVLPPLLGDDLVTSLAALSRQPWWVGPRRRMRAFADHDVLQFDFCAQATWMRRGGRGKIVYSAHNVEGDVVDAGQPRSGWRLAAAQRVAALERLAVRSSDLVLTCTRADGERLATLDRDTPFEVVPNGFEEMLLEVRRPGPRQTARAALGIEEGDLALVFLGGPARHNREAVAFLELEVLPRIVSTGRVHLLLVGQCATGAPSRNGVIALGFVPDLRSVLAAADIGLNPVRYGSGSNLKIASYLAAGLPVVTTAVGLRGYEDLREHVIVAEPADFADAVGRAEALDPAPPGSLEDLTWNALGSRLYKTYEALLREGA
jgi:glycosyltransferase involved in cell wall biosynthesis